MKLYHYRPQFLAMFLLAASCGPTDEGNLATLDSPITINTSATYTIVGVGSNKCLQIQGGSTADLARVQISTCNGSNAQAFRLELVTGGFYRIRNLGSNKCLDVQSASTADGAAVIQYTCGNGMNQQWSFVDVATGVVRVVARHSGKVMDVQGAGTADGTNVNQWTYGGRTNQQFRATTSGGGGGGTGGSGGSGSGGSSGGGTAGGGSTSGGGTTTCSEQPINPNATTQARKLLCYLYSQYGNHVLSGQQETSWAQNPADDVNFIFSNTGKFPAILGGDYLYPNGTSNRAISWWNAGGIPMIRYHMGAPPLADSYNNSLGSTNIGNVLTNGTSENASFRSKLDYAAAELQKLQAANVAVLWAPFHEAQPNGWFWWSKGSGAQYVQLWRFMYDYFTTTKRLNNLLWLMPFSGSPNSAFYPGKAFADLAGPDTYATSQPFTSNYNSTRSIVGSTIPIPLHETGTVPNPDSMFNNNAAPWVLFNIWAGYARNNNPLANIQSTYANARTVTRDEVPNLK